MSKMYWTFVTYLYVAYIFGPESRQIHHQLCKFDYWPFSESLTLLVSFGWTLEIIFAAEWGLWILSPITYIEAYKSNQTWKNIL